MTQKQTTVNTLASALVKAQRAFIPAVKNSTNPHFRNKYASLEAVIDAVRPALNEQGLALIQKTLDCETGVTVETIFLHESGEEYSAGVLHMPASKNDPQGYGSALTYARRYSLLAACGIAPEDDDGELASKPRPQSQPTTVRPRAEAKIEAAQIALIGELVQRAGWSAQDAKDYLRVEFGKQNRQELTATEAAKMIGALESIVNKEGEAA